MYDPLRRYYSLPLEIAAAAAAADDDDDDDDADDNGDDNCLDATLPAKDRSDSMSRIREKRQRSRTGPTNVSLTNSAVWASEEIVIDKSSSYCFTEDFKEILDCPKPALRFNRDREPDNSTTVQHASDTQWYSVENLVKKKSYLNGGKLNLTLFYLLLQL